jgi:hypothetical protein
MKRPVLSLARHIVLCAGIMLFLHSCKKSLSPAPLTSEVQQARDWFEKNVQNVQNDPSVSPRFSSAREPLWDQARTIPGNLAGALVIPVHYQRPLILGSNTGGPLVYPIDNIAHLLVYKDAADAFHAELVTAFPDSAFDASKAGAFSGLVLVESWQGTPIERIKSDGHTILVSQPEIEPNTVAAGFAGNDPCGIIYGYNYAADDPENGEYWQEGEGCPPDFALPGASSQIGRVAQTYLTIGGGGGSTPPSPAASFTVVSGDNPIVDIRAYMKCFQNSASSQYSVTLAVEQPIPGSRAPIYFPPIQLGGGYTIGHTYLIFQQNSGGVITRRSIGFYPKDNVSPFNPRGPGMLNDDETGPSNISIGFSLSAQQFMDMINYAMNSNGDVYDLNAFNCTTWSLDCLTAGGININTQQGTWFQGGGDDPGDLGEDVRGMALFSGMTRSTVSGDGPANTGTCN